MFTSFKEFFQSQFEQNPKQGQQNANTDHLVSLACSALLIEISRSDSKIQDEELEIIDQSIRDEFGLSLDETAELIKIANSKVDTSISLHEFTRVLNEHLDTEQRAHIVELLWRVAFADSVLDKYEEYYIRKIADLLYVSQQNYIKMKHKALEKNLGEKD